MILLVIAGTIFDVLHKKSARYFSENMRKQKANARREVGGGEMVSSAIKTAVVDVATSGEFCNPKRRIAHLLTMYGFIAFALSTAVMIYAYPTATDTPAIWPQLWHLGALMVCVGGYWFWFFIRVDVAAEGNSPFRVVPADLFVLSLLGSATFALIWSGLQAVNGIESGLTKIFFHGFTIATTVLFAGVPWSKFAHMFFKPAAAFQKRMTKADGSMENLPEVPDLNDPAVQERYPDIPEYLGKNPPDMGLGIKREAPSHY
jgi:predicted small integral membrane protein